MPKPRKKYKTWWKHLGTGLSHPFQYMSYKANKDRFTRANELQLHNHYQNEVNAPHPYPGGGGNVIYPDEGGVIDHANTVVAPGTNFMVPNAYDHQAARGANGVYRGGDMVTLRNEGGAVPIIRMAQKRHANPNPNTPGRTQHTTLTGGLPVAAAALRIRGANPRIKMSSGHYTPDDDAAVKLAIAGKSQGTLDRRSVNFQDSHNNDIDLTMKRRMRVVSNWAQTHSRAQFP